MEASFSGKVQESGLLTSLFPGLIQESHGDLELSAGIGGTWDNPIPEGALQLTNAGAYFPATGIKIKNVLVKAHFEGSRISVDTLQAESGSGNIQGTATLHLKQWHITSYEANIKGTNFQAIYLPEYRMAGSPDLTFKGTPKKASVRGGIKMSELLIFGPQTPAPIQPSADVIIVDRQPESAHKSPLLIDINVRVVLGDHAFVKAEGIDAQLKGDLVITARDINDIRGKGILDIAKGSYKRYGVDLKITRGRLLFSGGPLENPAIDVLALRTVEDVKAGVLVSGTLESPVIKLYSDPTMPDTDVLSYIVVGHATGQSKAEAPLMAKAAGFLLSKGESVVLQDQLKQKLGIDVLDVESSTGTTGGTTGSTTGSTTGGTTSRSLVTIGKYLTPRIYISYGQALLGSGSVVKLRYNLSKHLQVESESGSASGADLIYNINFQ